MFVLCQYYVGLFNNYLIDIIWFSDVLCRMSVSIIFFIRIFVLYSYIIMSFWIYSLIFLQFLSASTSSLRAKAAALNSTKASPSRRTKTSQNNYRETFTYSPTPASKRIGWRLARTFALWMCVQKNWTMNLVILPLLTQGKFRIKFVHIPLCIVVCAQFLFPLSIFSKTKSFLCHSV